MNIFSSIKSFAKDALEIMKYVLLHPSEWIAVIVVLYMVYQVFANIFDLPDRLNLYHTLIMVMVTSIYQNTKK